MRAGTVAGRAGLKGRCGNVTVGKHGVGASGEGGRESFRVREISSRCSRDKGNMEVRCTRGEGV
jgi:hypothetical protein